MRQVTSIQSQAKSARRWLIAARTLFALSFALAIAAFFLWYMWNHHSFLANPFWILVGFHLVILCVCLGRKPRLELGFSYALALFVFLILLLIAVLVIASAGILLMFLLVAVPRNDGPYLVGVLVLLSASFPVHLAWMTCSRMAAFRAEPRVRILGVTTLSFISICVISAFIIPAIGSVLALANRLK
jgi:hypothetical protein